MACIVTSFVNGFSRGIVFSFVGFLWSIYVLSEVIFFLDFTRYGVALVAGCVRAVYLICSEIA